MYAIEVRPKVGTEPSALAWTEQPRPSPGRGEVLLRVAATALNRADLLQRRGLYPPPPGASTILGLECSGIVEDVGADTDVEWRGQRVAALVEGGAYAEYCVARTDLLLPLGAEVGDLAGAALPESLATCWLNLFRLGRAARGETVLVQGATSGIGTLAVQLARAAGCRVVATASSEAKRAVSISLGADVALDYRSPDLGQEVMEATHGRGVDVVLDNVGPSNLDFYATVLADHGRIMMIGTQGGREGSFGAGPLMAKQAEIRLTSLRRTAPRDKSSMMREVRDTAWPWVLSGQLMPVVDSVFDLPEAGRAHERLDLGEHVGKVVLTSAGGKQDLRGSHPVSPALRHGGTAT